MLDNILKFIMYAFILTILFQVSAMSYEVRTPEQFRMTQKQQYWDKTTHQIVQPMFKTQHERNHYVTEKFICVQQDINDFGYVYVRYTYGRLVRQWENNLNGYSRSPMRCHILYDRYTNVATVQQAKTFQFTKETLNKPHYYFNPLLKEYAEQYFNKPHNRNYL